MQRADVTTSAAACPACGGHDFKRWDYRNPWIIHWILNPVLCVNELLLGQRIPKVMLSCNTCDEPFVDRYYIPCAVCGAMNGGRIWSYRRGFGHWWGFVCPSCGNPVPCLWNLCSLVILTVTFPIWYLPAKFIRPRWLEFERRRMASARGADIKPASEISWIRIGVLGWGGIMWAIFSVAAILRGDSVWVIPAMIPIFGVCGLLWGLFMKAFMNQRPTKTL